MDREQVSRWLADYTGAWRSNDRDQITRLFSADAQYRYHPYEEPVVGAEAIADGWLDEPDDPATWEATFEPVAIDGDTAVAVGTSSYRATDDQPARTYHNCFVMRFDDDARCREFTEWFMKAPDGAG